MKKSIIEEIKKLTIGIIGYIVLNCVFAFAIYWLDSLDGKVYRVIEKGFISVAGGCLLFFCYYVYSILKSLFDFNIKKHSCKHLEKILHSGCKVLGKTEVQQLYDIAFGDNNIAIDWMKKHQEMAKELDRKIQYYDLPQSEKASLKEELDILNKKTDVVFYLRSYKKQEYEVDEIYNKVLNEY